LDIGDSGSFDAAAFDAWRRRGKAGFGDGAVKLA
jgi:hypothetical protein